MKSEIKSPYATLKEAAAYVRISYFQASRDWPEWKEKFGVRISRIGNGLRMRYTDLDSMMEQREIA
jgi:hypothetical protein